MENWVHIKELSGQGNKELIVIVDPNSSFKERQTQITGSTLNNKTDILTIIQKGMEINFIVFRYSPSSGKGTWYLNGELASSSEVKQAIENSITKCKPYIGMIWNLSYGYTTGLDLNPTTGIFYATTFSNSNGSTKRIQIDKSTVTDFM